MCALSGVVCVLIVYVLWHIVNMLCVCDACACRGVCCKGGVLCALPSCVRVIYMHECYLVCLLCVNAVGSEHAACMHRVCMPHVLYRICSESVLSVVFVPCLCRTYPFILDGTRAVCELYALPCEVCIL